MSGLSYYGNVDRAYGRPRQDGRGGFPIIPERQIGNKRLRDFLRIFGRNGNKTPSGMENLNRMYKYSNVRGSGSLPSWMRPSQPQQTDNQPIVYYDQGNMYDRYRSRS